MVHMYVAFNSAITGAARMHYSTHRYSGVVWDWRRLLGVTLVVMYLSGPNESVE